VTGVLAILPMRHSSERVPGKNFRLFNGQPLFHHIVRTLLAVEVIDEIVIDTDSPPVAEQVQEVFPDRVRVIERPEHLRSGETAMNDVLLHTVSVCPADVYLHTHSTNPLLRFETVARALSEFLSATPKVDSLFYPRVGWDRASAATRPAGRIDRNLFGRSEWSCHQMSKPRLSR
jgi:CMP-N-acetylneuraminic acid synthetase